ncbi:MAG TPA: hypothetical protein VG736_12210 [Vicinamibacterales bacterium]|jgi:hypothetical protein|nr:hypothetical protein [Vicinamibacterales bacterium]
MTAIGMSAALAGASAALRAQTIAAVVPSGSVETTAHRPQDFVGVWTYNAGDSVDVATGKPEQGPKGTPARSTRTAAPRPTPNDGGADRLGGPDQGRQPEFGPSPLALRASRDLMRDLLEVPQSLDVKVASNAVTMIDDIDRSRTYPTDGSRQHYRLGGSEFNARVQWRDSQLRKDIDAAFGFKMTEVYYLSDDGQRLFVILRVAGAPRNAPIGANRVYDRAEAK